MFWSERQKEQKPLWLPEKALFEALAQMITEALLVYDKDFKILVFNKQAEEIFRIKASDIIGQNFTLEAAQDPKWQNLSPVIYSSLAPTVVPLSDAGVNPQVAKVILDNPRREYEVTTLESSGNFIKLIKDKSREAGLIKAKSEFITIAAHQLRTPATSVSWTFENLNKDPNLTEEAKNLVATGHKAAQVLLKIINDLLNVSQIEEGRFGYNFQEINLVDSLDKLLADILPVAQEYKVSIYFDRPPEKEVLVSADPNRLAMAVVNLVENGIRYNLTNGEVTVKLEIKDGNAQVSVKDTGIGIKEEDLPKLFSKFFRGENIQKTVPTGSGLGLYIVKNIIEAHKGKVWAESVPSRGSTFYFTIPLK